MTWWPYCKGCSFSPEWFCRMFPGDMWLLAHATREETDDFVLWQRRDKLWLSLGCEHPNPAPLKPVLSVLSGPVTSFPTLPDHYSGFQKPHWSAGPISVQIISPYAIKYCCLWFHVDGFYLIRDLVRPLKQDVRPPCSRQVSIMDSGARLGWNPGALHFVSEVIWASLITSLDLSLLL